MIMSSSKLGYRVAKEIRDTSIRIMLAITMSAKKTIGSIPLTESVSLQVYLKKMAEVRARATPAPQLINQ